MSPEMPHYWDLSRDSRNLKRLEAEVDNLIERIQVAPAVEALAGEIEMKLVEIEQKVQELLEEHKTKSKERGEYIRILQKLRAALPPSWRETSIKL